MSNYLLCRTSYENFDLRKQSGDYITNLDDAIKLVDVTISMFGKIEINEFFDIDKGLSYNLNKGLNYKFIEISDNNGINFFYVAEIYALDKIAFLTSQMRVIGIYWNLYLNSWNNIYAQGNGDVVNSKFSFTDDNRKYLYLSVLLYTLTHIDHQDLVNEFEVNKKII